MKALVLNQYNKFDYQEMDKPEISPRDVLIQVKAAGICGSDVHGMDGSTGRRQPPLIMGHEASGIITQKGDEVTHWKSGDRVTFDSTIYCGRCGFCRRGKINLCTDRRVLGVSCDEYRQHGAFAEYVAVPQHTLYALPENLTFEQAAMAEPLSIAFHAVGRGQVSLNDTAVVVGAGMIGLLVIQTLRTAGCGRIIAVDLDQDKLDLARKLGADVGLLADEGQVPDRVAQLTRGRGADVAFEAVGITASVTTAVASLRKGGVLTLVGNLSSKVEMPLQAVVTREITLNGSCASCGEYPACLDMIARGRIDVNALISVTAPLHEGDQWFQRLYAKEPGLMKVILVP